MRVDEEKWIERQVEQEVRMEWNDVEGGKKREEVASGGSKERPTERQE